MAGKPFFIRVLATALSITVLLGAVGITADFHICQDKVKTFSFFGQAEKCSEMEISSICVPSEDKSSVKRKQCCTNESLYNMASFQTTVDSEYFPNSKNNINEVFLPAVSSSHSVAHITKNNWVIPDPPLIRQDLSLIISFQSFLI